MYKFGSQYSLEIRIDEAWGWMKIYANVNSKYVCLWHTYFFKLWLVWKSMKLRENRFCYQLNRPKEYGLVLLQDVPRSGKSNWYRQYLRCLVSCGSEMWAIPVRVSPTVTNTERTVRTVDNTVTVGYQNQGETAVGIPGFLSHKTSNWSCEGQPRVLSKAAAGQQLFRKRENRFPSLRRSRHNGT